MNIESLAAEVSKRIAERGLPADPELVSAFVQRRAAMTVKELVDEYIDNCNAQYEDYLRMNWQ